VAKTGVGKDTAKEARAAKQTVPKETVAKESTAKENTAKESAPKESGAKESGAKESAAKESGAKESGAATTSAKKVARALPPGVVSAGTEEEAAAGASKVKRARTAPAKKAGGADGAGDRRAEDGEPREVFLEQQRALLMAERRNYTRQAEELRAQAEALALEHEPGDVQFDEEGGEGGTANVDRELDLHLSAQAHAAIEEIDAALEKITAGTYGFCESCGSPVPKARLEALPHARLCVSCKSGGLSARRQ
jgi:DnaK suppressor protein